MCLQEEEEKCLGLEEEEKEMHFRGGRGGPEEEVRFRGG